MSNSLKEEFSGKAIFSVVCVLYLVVTFGSLFIKSQAEEERENLRDFTVKCKQLTGNGLVGDIEFKGVDKYHRYRYCVDLNEQRGLEVPYHEEI